MPNRILCYNNELCCVGSKNERKKTTQGLCSLSVVEALLAPLKWGYYWLEAGCVGWALNFIQKFPYCLFIDGIKLSLKWFIFRNFSF